MSNPRKLSEFQPIKELALEDLMSLSDDQLRMEAQEDGDNINALAFQLKKSLRETTALAVRTELMRSNNRNALLSPPEPSRPNLSLEKLKAIVDQVFANNPDLGLAYRDGTKQSEEDWYSLWDDLVAMKKINPAEYES